jgi:hypothetical protein
VSGKSTARKRGKRAVDIAFNVAIVGQSHGVVVTDVTSDSPVQNFGDVWHINHSYLNNDEVQTLVTTTVS